MNIRIYALHDSDEKARGSEGAFEITHLDTTEGFDIVNMNEQGYGIFWTLNDYDGDRKAENVTRINYWYCDIDDGSKEEQMDRINNLPIYPTMIVESNKGYHCYWRAKYATVDNFRKIETKIIELAGGDKHCKDPVRLLRMPYMNHMKYPDSPFFCDVVEDNDREILEEQMLNAFGCYENPKPRPEYKGDKNDFLNPDKWEKIFKISGIRQGNRNANLYRIKKWLIDEGFPFYQVKDVIYAINNQLSQPLSESEMKGLTKDVS